MRGKECVCGGKGRGNGKKRTAQELIIKSLTLESEGLDSSLSTTTCWLQDLGQGPRDPEPQFFFIHKVEVTVVGSS